VKPARVTRLSLALTLVATGLWWLSTDRARLALGEYGLLTSFPPGYLLAVGLVTIASFLLWRSPEGHGGLLFCQLFLVIASLLLVPVLIGGQHRGGSVWINGFPEVDYVLQQGHLNAWARWYHVYPTAWIFSAALIQILGVTDVNLLYNVTPFFWQLVYFPLVYVFLRNSIGAHRMREIWAGVWLFYLAEWLGFSSLHPQTFGWIFFLVLLALLSVGWRRRGGTDAHRLPSTLVSAGLILSHSLSSLFGLAAMAILVLRKQVSVTLLVVLTLGLAAWTLYGAAIFFESNLGEAIDHAFRIDEVWRLGFATRVASPNPAHDLLNTLRFWYTAAFLAVGLLGMILRLIAGKPGGQDLNMVGMGTGIILVALATGFSYRHEIIDKTYLFGLPFLAYFGATLLRRQVTAMLVYLLLLLAPPAYMATHYANALTDHLSRANLAGLSFFNRHTAGGGTLTGNYNAWGVPVYAGWLVSYYEYPPQGFVPIGGILRHPETYAGIPFEQLRFRSDGALAEGSDLTYPHYIAVSQRDQAVYYWVWNRRDFIRQVEASLENAANCSLVYSSPGMRLHIVERGL